MSSANLSTRAYASIALLLGTLTACGGKVVVDARGGGGYGGQGGQGGQADVAASSSTGGTSLEEATCTSFCAIAGEKGCPTGGDCQARCVAMFVDACVSEVKATLDCTASYLGLACFIVYPSTGDDCAAKVDSAIQCLSSVAGFDCPGFDNGTAGDGSCVAKGTCDIGNLLMTCDAQGTCTCVADGQVVGTCKNLLVGGEFCSVSRSCCTPLFAK